MKIKRTKLWEINGDIFAANTIEEAISIFYAVAERAKVTAFPRYVKPVSIASGCESVYYSDDLEDLKVEKFNGLASVMDGEEW